MPFPKDVNLKHGKTGTSIFTIWVSMKQRCLNKNCQAYKNYGGRGIKVCKKWMKFENFYKDMGDRPEKMSLDRINNNGNYEPSNCRWASRKVQGNNSRWNVVINYNGKTQTAIQWAEELNINVKALYTRVKRKWTLERVFNEPFKKYIPEIIFTKDQFQEIKNLYPKLRQWQIAEKFNVSQATISEILNNKKTYHEPRIQEKIF